MRTALLYFQNQTKIPQEDKNDRPISLMSIDVKILTKVSKLNLTVC